jgi:hypothetical protein
VAPAKLVIPKPVPAAATVRKSRREKESLSGVFSFIRSCLSALFECLFLTGGHSTLVLMAMPAVGGPFTAPVCVAVIGRGKKRR